MTSDFLKRATGIPSPTPARKPHSITTWNTTRVDDYAWMKDENWQQVMRDPSVLDPEIRAHLEAENQHTDAVLQPTKSLQDILFKEMRGRIKEDDSSVPDRDGPWHYYTRFREGGQYPVFARKPSRDDGSIGSDETILLDGDAMGDGHDYLDFATVDHSPDHSLLVYAIDTKGSEFYEIRVRDLSSGEDIATLTDEGYGAVVWANDSRTLYWIWRDPNNRPKRLYRQAIDQSEPELIYEEADDGYFLSLGKSDGDSFVELGAHDHTTSEIHLIDADDPSARPKLVAERESGVEYSLTEAGGQFWIRTNLDGAVDFKLMSAPLNAPERENWQTVIDHRPGTLMLDTVGYEHWLVRLERENALPRIVIRSLADGNEHRIDFREEAYALGLDGGLEYKTDTVRFSYESPARPQEVYAYNMADRSRSLLKVQEIPSGHDPEHYVVRRIEAPARDGERIPVTILHHRDTPVDGTAPCILYGYGSYGITIPASFSSGRLSLVDRGMVFAIAHIRGGMAKGYQWYLDGRKQQKTNTFNDFVDAGKALVQEGFTAERQIIAYGGSAGGLLVGAAINQAPDLFSGAIAAVPFVDVLNTMSDASLPLTPPEWPEWGNPIEDEAAYRQILDWSPYDQVQDKAYPHVLATAGLTDPRVTYWEPAKWIARLREKRTDDGLSLLRIQMGAGHGGASGRFDALKERAEEYAFALAISGLGQS